MLFLLSVINKELAPVRARRAEYEKDIPGVYEILRKGCEAAQKEAASTLAAVKAAMKINYFDDAALIQGQQEKFNNK